MYDPVWISIPPREPGPDSFFSWSADLKARQYRSLPPPPRPYYRAPNVNAPDPLSVEEYSKSNFEWKRRVEAEEARKRARAADPRPPVWTPRAVPPKPQEECAVKRFASFMWGILMGR